MTPEPLVLDPAAGITVQMGESRLTIKLDADATGGRIALLQYDVAPNFVAPRTPHWHTRESHTIVVVEGRLRFEFGSRVVEGAPGTVIHIPELCGFTWLNPDPTPARMYYVFAPAGLEQYFRDVQNVFAEHPGMTTSEAAPFVKKLWAKYGIEM